MASVTLYRVPGADLGNDSVGQILSDERRPIEVPLRTGIPARLFLLRSEPRPPEWTIYLRSLVHDTLDVPDRETVGAVLLLRPDSRRRLLYAATWGSGHFLLRSAYLEPDLGLRCALNLISPAGASASSWDPARVRSLRSKTVSQNTLITDIQASRKAPIDTFPFRADTDQLRQVTGTPTDTEAWGTTVTGGMSIHVQRPDNASNLLELCRRVERASKSRAYQERYGWIDNISPVRDVELLDEVYARFIQEIREEDTGALSLSPPSLVTWERTTAFEGSSGFGVGARLMDRDSETRRAPGASVRGRCPRARRAPDGGEPRPQHGAAFAA